MKFSKLAHQPIAVDKSQSEKLVSTTLPDNLLTPQQKDKIQKNLLELYNNYCKLGFVIKSSRTFDGIQQLTQSLPLNKYLLFAKNFEIMPQHLSRVETIEIFKKHAKNSETAQYIDFLLILQQMADIMFMRKSGQSDPARSAPPKSQPETLEADDKQQTPENERAEDPEGTDGK